MSPSLIFLRTRKRNLISTAKKRIRKKESNSNAPLLIKKEMEK